eukprot:2758896-Rhodomonas_salina.5
MSATWLYAHRIWFGTWATQASVVGGGRVHSHPDDRCRQHTEARTPAQSATCLTSHRTFSFGKE